MTLCMAAICDDGNDGPKAVIASDRMVTLGGFMEFEHTVSKMKEATSCAVAMIAGDTLVGTRLAQGVGEEFKGASPDIAQIAVRLAQRYVEVRTGELEHQILNPRGLNLQGFYGAHQGLNAQIAAMIDQQMAQFNLGIELLLAGVDSQGAHIYSVTNPGQPDRQWDVIGYAAVGSGGIHAV
jgi:20S proteasome alpha/beta subunit